MSILLLSKSYKIRKTKGRRDQEVQNACGKPSNWSLFL